MFPSTKNRCPVAYANPLKRDFRVLFEDERDVRAYGEAPANCPHSASPPRISTNTFAHSPKAFSTVAVRLLASMSALMLRLTRRLLPRRKEFPTLYSARQEAAARFKAVYVESCTDPAERFGGAGIVAALLGHTTDETASQHYERPSRRGGGEAMPTPRANPDGVARVRKRLEESLAKMAGRHPPSGPSPMKRL